MAKPFLKWAGGKTWFIINEKDRLPQNYNRYIEPFLGGASVFFHLNPREAILTDINRELINTYIAVKEDFDKVYKHLREHERKHCQEYYYEIRNMRPRAKSTAAARMIYLNKTCFNGIYRTNGNGDFNVPYGTDKQVAFDKNDLRDSSQALNNATLYCQSFRETINLAQENDFLFCDPPYVVPNETSRFELYGLDLFTWNDQLALAELLHQALDRGVKIILTNIEHPDVRALYEDDPRFHLDTLMRKCTISGTSDGRKDYRELVVSANIQ